MRKRDRLVYACGPMQLLPQGQDEPTYRTVAEALTRADRQVLREALVWDMQSSGSSRVERRVRRVAARLGLVLAVCLLVSGCGQLNSKPASAGVASNIVYVWEPSAGLCFATLNSTTHGGFLVTSLAHVPARACGKPER